MKLQILLRGSDLWVRSTCAGVGSLRPVTVGAGPMTRLGYSSKSGGVNSSTMKGPQGLTGKLLRRRCRNVPRNSIFVPGADEEPWLMGKGGFLCSNP